MRASSAPQYGDSLIQNYMKKLSSGKGEFVTGGSKPPLKPALSVIPSTTGRKDEMVAGNSYTYQRIRKSKDRTSASSGHHDRSQQHEASSHGKEKTRRRSVSPQMQKKQIPPQPTSLPTIESASVSTAEPPLLHKKPPKKKIDMSLVDNRLKTFGWMRPRWEVEGVDYHPIASAGFYYTGQEDITKCFECDIVLCDWSAHDDPLELHFNKSPNCAYLRKDHPMAVEDLCSSKFDMYKEFGIRVKSFNTYPHRGYTIDAKSIANSGFFYTGADDKTQCFACGFVKRNWTKEDDPIFVHRNFYNECPYLKKIDKNLHENASSNEAVALKKPDYSIASVRLLSFKHYSTQHNIDKEDFVNAGFFFLSPPQTVKCFACNLVVDCWLPGDTPLKKHLQLNSSCPFLQDGKDSPPPDSSSLPLPAYSYNDMVNKFKGTSIANHETDRQDERKDESKDVTASTRQNRELFNLPIHLPPKYKMRGATSSTPTYHTYPSTESPTPSDETFHSLTEDDKLCIICFDKLKEYAIVPCGHLCTCGDCSERLRNCPVCRRPKQSVIRIFNT